MASNNNKAKRRQPGKKNTQNQPKNNQQAPKKFTPAQERKLIRQVIKRQESVLRRDIEDLRKAKQQATSVYEPRQLQLQTLYEEIMDDALMTSQVSVLRIGKSQSSDFSLTLNGEIDDEATETLKDSGLFEDCVELIVEAVFFGHSILEFDYTPEGLEVDIVPRKHISPENGRFYPDAAGANFIEYRELPEYRRWNVEIYPRKRDLGLLFKAAPYVLIKKFAVACWSELCEIFGIPPRVLKTNTQDDEMLSRAERMMKEIGSAAYFIIDQNEDFNFANRSETNGDVYKNLIATCNQELSLLNLAAVVGQDTLNGNRSKEESSSELMEAVIKADRRLIESAFNKKILPALASIGFLKPGLRLKIAKELDLASLWKMVIEAAAHWELDWEWVKDTFGLEIVGKKAYNVTPPAGNPDEGNQTKPGADQREGNQPDPDKQPPQEPAEGTPPSAAKKAKEEEELAVFLDAPQDGASNGTAPIGFNDRLLHRVAAGQSKYFDAELFWFIASDLLNGIKTSFKTTLASPGIGVVYGAPDDVYTAALEQNVFHFSAAKTLAEVQELNQAFREAGSYNEFKNRASAITTTFNDTWQRTEYQTAVQMAEAASNYRSLKAQTRLFPIWRYRTAGDDQVRDEHALLNNLELPADHPKWKEIFPPNGWRCRCTVEAIMEDEHEGDFTDDLAKVEQYQATGDWKNAKAQGWAVNRAEVAEVFAADQMYIRKFPEMAAKYLGKLGHKEYGLPSFAARTKAATRNITGYNRQPSAWLAKNAEIKDFSGKVVTIPAKTFESLTTGEYGATRVNLLGNLQDVLKRPDEVWYSGTGKTFDRYRYLKFYQDRAIVVECGISGQSFDVLSWQEVGRPAGKIARAQDPRVQFRSGLLIKK